MAHLSTSCLRSYEFSVDPLISHIQPNSNDQKTCLDCSFESVTLVREKGECVDLGLDLDLG